mgnify:CR=1 FL=1|jgi:hypothetical protein
MAIDLLTGKEWNPDANMLPMADKNGKRYAMLYEPGHQHHGWIFYDNHGTWVTYRVGLMHEVLRAGRIIEDKKRHEPCQGA